MVITTTPSVDGKSISDYKGIVVGEAILGVDIDYAVINAMMMVSASGTAVKLS